MKHLSLLVLVMLLSTSAFAQKKKDKASAAQTDSLMLVNMALNVRLDSVTKDLTAYQGMYDAVRTKVLKYDFDPNRMSVLIDSLVMSRDSTFRGMNATQTSLMDSVTVLRERNMQLQGALDEINAAAALHSDRTVVINELKQWKALLDALVITQDEYNVQKKKLLEKL